MVSFGTIREIQPDEVELMLAWRNAPSVRQNMYTNHVITLAEHLKWWESTKQNNKSQYFMFESNGQPYGIIGFTGIDRLNRCTSWAFYAAPGSPRGTGSKMEFQALEYAFNTLKLNKIFCEVLSFNAAVIKLHKKFGFVEEGVFRQQHLVDGIFTDVHRLGLLESEWAEQKSAVRSRLEKLFKIPKE
ncbi:UDP-4-amino-4,6-dideoxy-N-acetyl-beta-L-altrosamine N-acetyltransferase [Endozoicomonas sp. OPT23]|uniref:UDP-4-amino-4, 6-dideoxy-N-acetyl-beta-L-altrosamine N-acetyltransferase n=1 Tax=Endozoicomonas sp. OPT23 TaxID=2072845 RepID=UPI00129AB78D|nr:UDP-4-amino-4,6-dideoxy-N-acetyl-beta-L-altrosamine N-acetyltransferase [Endozoicomonas sp. OPT23]MRI34297.1 UDP-4-amino-4,6-dideoxy-N-acetyl-beta-L-altrosamine N-acetyltransferase [Endozoicomonas sp. OPT23]